MNSTTIRSLAWLFVTSIAFGAITLWAQSDIATGTIQGWVSDSLGGRLPSVTLTAINTETGFSQSRQTDAEGRFQIRLLPPCHYTLRAELDGFALFEQRGIQLQVGDALTLRVTLQLATVTDEVLVTEEAPLVETARASITTTIGSTALDTLPLDGRNFGDLVTLAPQVVVSPPVSPIEARPTVAGDEGLMNVFNIDGADATSAFFGDQLGGTQPPFTYSQSAIQEFQVLRSSYNVRFGGASGGIINAVTKSGTNTLHGGAFVYFQNDSMTTTDALGNEQDDFERQQFGLNLGGPIMRDKLHFFVAYDGQRRDQNVFKRPFGLPPMLEPAFNAKLASLGIDPTTEFDYVVTNDVDVLLFRFDWTINASHRIWFRNNYLDQAGENNTLSFFTSGLSNLGLQESSFNSSVLSLNSVLGPRSFNEAIIQYVPAEQPQSSNFTDIPMTALDFFGGAIIGQNFILPNFTNEDRLQIQDNFSTQVGNHLLRIGLDYSNVATENRFLFQGGGTYVMDSYLTFVQEDPCNPPLGPFPWCSYRQAFSPTNGRLDHDTDFFSIYAGDEWVVSPRLILEYGLRLDHQNNPSAQNPNPLEPQTANIPDDTDVAPRVGFAWDVRGTGRSVLRGGAGLFIGRTPALVAATAVSNNGINSFGVTLFWFQPNFPTYPDRISPEVGAAEPPNISLMDPSFENPETYRFSLGYEQAVGRNWSLGAELTYSESKHRLRGADINLDPTPVDFTVDGRRIYGVGMGSRARLDPRFGEKIQFTSNAEAEYFSLVLTASRRFSRNWTMQANYTYSEAKDHDTC